MERKVLLVLYTRYTGYMHAGYKMLAKYFNYHVHIIKYQTESNAPFQIKPENNITFYNRNDYNYEKIIDLAKTLKPLALHTSGWNDRDYYRVAKKLKNDGILTICGLDNQWKNTLKQHLLCILSYFTLRKHYTHLWIPGMFQYEYARRLGYNRQNIILNYYSADTSIFKSSSSPPNVFDKIFIYVGKLEKIKGTYTLIDALKLARKDLENHGWQFLIIGNGELANFANEQINFDETIQHIPFLQPTELFELGRNRTGIFVLPSNYDAWGVVVHEFAILGYPFIISNAVGAQNAFVRDGYNGYIFPKENPQALYQRILQVMEKSETELLEMSKRSVILSQSISTEIWAHTLHNAIESFKNE